MIKLSTVSFRFTTTTIRTVIKIGGRIQTTTSTIWPHHQHHLAGLGAPGAFSNSRVFSTPPVLGSLPHYLAPLLELGRSLMVTITLLVMRSKLIKGGQNCARYILVPSEQIILQFHCTEQMSPSRLYNITTRLQVAQLSITIKVCAALVHSSILLLINLPGGWGGRGGINQNVCYFIKRWWNLWKCCVVIRTM